jgi:SET domain-containing protein
MEEGEEARISIVALRPIAKGEEITINYLDDDDADYKSRQQMLWEKYLFNCYCEKCQEEKAQLDADQKNEKETKTNTEEDAKDQPKEEEKVQTEQKP